MSIFFGPFSPDAAFEQGFYGKAFAKLDRLGPKTVRHLYETGKLADEIEHNAAEIWLERNDRSEARRAIVLVCVGVLTLAVSTTNLIATFLMK